MKNTLRTPNQKMRDMEMFEKLDTFCKFPGCGRTKASHTFDEWNQHKEMAKLRRGSSLSALQGFGLGCLIMAWSIIGYHAFMVWVFK